MKPGSIVVCRKIAVGDINEPYVKWLPQMDEKTPYMIRDECMCEGTKEVVVFFEEGIIGYNIHNYELGFPLSHIREILPPEDIAEQVEDMMCVPVDK